MRAAYLGAFFLVVVASGSASTLNDTFGQPGTCTPSFSPPYDGGCDVMGRNSLYDIQGADVSVTPGWVSVTLFYNFGTPDLTPFFDANVTLKPGDILFFDPSDPKTTTYKDLANHPGYPKYLFSVPLSAHDGFTPGDLYEIVYTATNPSPLKTADSILHNTNSYYRRNEPVWLGPGATREAVGSGVTVSSLGNGVSGALYNATIGFVPSAAFLAMTSGGSLGLQWAVATCGNDILKGVVPVTATPEPAPLAMLLCGMAALAVVKLRRR